MTIKNFRALAMQTQFDLLFTEGRLTIRRSYFQRTVLIYSFEDFFVKVVLAKHNQSLLHVCAYEVSELPVHYSNQMRCESRLIGSRLAFAPQGGSNPIDLTMFVH